MFEMGRDRHKEQELENNLEEEISSSDTMKSLTEMKHLKSAVTRLLPTNWIAGRREAVGAEDFRQGSTTWWSVPATASHGTPV